MEPTTNLLTVQDVAAKLKVTPQYVRKLIKEEKLATDRIGSQWLIRPELVDEYITAYDVFIEPDDHERLTNDVPDIVALSFFSGAMGLDIGMENGGIEALLACEFNKYCRMTIAKNKPNMALIGDINNYSAEEILKLAKVPEGRKVDVIFGGPPCQAFSTAGARRAFNDDRGNVFLRYNAANFGAPQIRERVVIIGKLGDEKVPYLSPTHDQDSRFGLQPWVTFSSVVADIEGKEHHYIEFPEYRLRFYRMLKAGQYWKDLPKELQREAMGRSLDLGGGKTGFYRRISLDRPSPTLVTNPTMPATDLCHPTEDRPLSVEEYSRVQGFPDDWEICGPILEQYKQIGNAVPLKLGEAIAKTVIADMNGQVLPHYEGYLYSRYKNTNDITWQKARDVALAKAKEKAARSKNEYEQLSLDLSNF